MKLRYIHRGDFRKNELTLMQEVSRDVPELKLGDGDCVLLLSHSRKMLRFVYGVREVEHEAKMVQVLPSQTYRITGGGVWNPLMLANYAAAVGIELQGLRRFETHYRELIARKRKGR